jgi:hypothetical protein
MSLVTGDVGDLALLDPGGGGGGRVAGAQRVPGELWEQLGGKVGGPGAALDDQRDGLIGEALLADGVAAAHPAEHRPAVDLRGLQPLAERADGAAVSRTAQRSVSRA